MEFDQQKTPLFTGLKQYASKNPTPFHIPGHKKGQGMEPSFRDFIGENALSIDLINIAPLDDLHHPHGFIHEAQQLAANAFGADYTFFSVQGTSGAIMTMIMSVCKPGDKIIVPRNVHKSIMSAIIFSGAMPVFVHPVVDRTHGIAHGVTTESIQRAVEAHPDAKAVLVINPTYYGFACDLKEIVKIAHSASIPVLVDEAHGVHTHFSEDLPISAMEAGADMAATSVHKLGGSLTQSSVLNVKSGLVSVDHTTAIMSMLTTTSTSYLLLASLDVARKHLATKGRSELARVIDLSHSARKRLNSINGIHCVGAECLTSSATFAHDPTKLFISLNELSISGYEAEVWLRDNYGIEVELSDLYNILCIITLGDDQTKVDLLLNALTELAHSFKQSEKQTVQLDVKVPDIPTLALSPRDAFYAQTEFVSFQESTGRIIAEFIMVYPPGIPILSPGELITQENLDYVKENMAAGLPVQGPEDQTLAFLKVIKEQSAIV
ncbi:aminotransferase class I/II-fold pyridoxal phosphate-dependent enzyme [Alkalihalobacillus sp. LMS6]|uniref:aminotransferase class I/II-fold pyridoxal phosphate-dependent enzyme n=1 Tax=Alkalihalobacillus sp. LMS6 TaxID=2924034 RepID=UPI0020D1E94F|nr:aminotransferase class I/II-fold pyridoxal phosphate-dependent enzyme [Alkalihalobacillus sp. LMS6]UTR04899.1 aminotransferase class I/II-fold pyridoxal phosphate-dependent enzyme [Alkalihalobacillus sp. LMS6]